MMSNSDGFVYMEKYGISVRPDGAVKTVVKGIHFGSQDGRGYMQVKVNQNLHKVHRLILEAFVGDSQRQVNHKNGISCDNRLSNLEYCDNAYNSRHRSVISGCRGTTRSRSGRWRAQITSNYQNINLGYFDSEKDAHQVYLDAREKLWGIA